MGWIFFGKLFIQLTTYYKAYNENHCSVLVQFDFRHNLHYFVFLIKSTFLLLQVQHAYCENLDFRNIEKDSKVHKVVIILRVIYVQHFYFWDLHKILRILQSKEDNNEKLLLCFYADVLQQGFCLLFCFYYNLLILKYIYNICYILYINICIIY